jgi:hypothetical protein
MKGMFSILVFAILLAGCDDSDDDSGGHSSETVADIQRKAGNGQWRITYFFDTDEEETDNFTGYIFEFNNGDIVTATDGSNNYSGNWSVTHDGSHDDNHTQFEDIDFNIEFSHPDDFEELSEDWEIISLSDSKIELRHISGGNGGTDLLTFEKL